MGFPLRSNIFKSGTNEQSYFSQFPIQVVVLFSPTDDEFTQAFKDTFLELDKITGNSLAFFAVLDPPDDWITEARNRDWWREYQQRIGRVGFSVNERVLVREIARLFGVAWHSFPSIVVGTDLWTGEFVTSATSPFHIKRQLETLTDLVKEWGKPNIGHITDTLEESFGFETDYHPPDDELRYRFNRVYGALDTVTDPNRFDRRRYQRLLDIELRAVRNNLNRLRSPKRKDWRGAEAQESELGTSNSLVEDIIEDATGRLVAPATVAIRVFRDLKRKRDIPDMFEEESLAMVETALTVGNFLEGLVNNALYGVAPLRFGGRRSSDTSVDFTPGAQGAWKAFELEINLSVIQAARASRSVIMPDFFALYDSNLPKEQGRVQTGTVRGRPIYKDINQRDWKAKRTGRHRFLTLGEAWHVTRAMSGAPNEDFDTVVERCLGRPLPPTLLDAWKQIYLIRNKASHIQSLHENEYAIVLNTALSPDILQPLFRIKEHLSN